MGLISVFSGFFHKAAVQAKHCKRPIDELKSPLEILSDSDAITQAQEPIMLASMAIFNTYGVICCTPPLVDCRAPRATRRISSSKTLVPSPSLIHDLNSRHSSSFSISSSVLLSSAFSSRSSSMSMSLQSTPFAIPPQPFVLNPNPPKSNKSIIFLVS